MAQSRGYLHIPVARDCSIQSRPTRGSQISVDDPKRLSSYFFVMMRLISESSELVITWTLPPFLDKIASMDLASWVLNPQRPTFIPQNIYGSLNYSLIYNGLPAFIDSYSHFIVKHSVMFFFSFAIYPIQDWVPCIFRWRCSQQAGCRSLEQVAR